MTKEEEELWKNPDGKGPDIKRIESGSKDEPPGRVTR